ncbi:predicted protein [Arabidopsis lyrata subsp. lyrata]|uniref:Predicted protein n=1 Tax=Arabidopsis lyrata subsp. lyrata TaxID=81972 RepID=D7KCR7_ARALL|nr:predicted protein [Arabidopsis lyrata subsp. lyrata]
MPLFLMKLELKIRSLRGLNKPKYIQCGNVALGRKMKTIEYLACKSVDKSQKSKGFHEVIMKSVSSFPN